MIVLMALLGASRAAAAAEECVILLHGLARTEDAMQPMAEFLAAEGFDTANVGYPSREKSIEKLAPAAIEQGLNQCAKADRVHFVTHSMGGILVRYYLGKKPLERLGHVVMLAPPNQGSEVVDRLRTVPGFDLINGPAGLQLGTGENSLPRQLGPVDYSVGIIAGSETFNPLLSQALPNPDDGKVSVDATRVEGMSDFLVVPHSHPFIMRAESVKRQTSFFLRNGRFDHDVAPSEDGVSRRSDTPQA
ncbi:MAG: alpha/beta hydrolase [Pseudomonadota bacterium]